MEPANSWEVSYILSIYRPYGQPLITDISQKEFYYKLGGKRLKELSQWAWDNIDNKWIKDHK